MRFSAYASLLYAGLLSTVLEAAPLSDQKIQTLYNSLNPSSISQHLAFYELYSAHPLGKQALQDACQLLAGKQKSESASFSEISFSSVIQALIGLVNKQEDQELAPLPDKDLQELEKFSLRLSHHRLKGHHVWSEAEVLELPADEIDLARGLFLSQFGSDAGRIKTYEMLIDLMALQILAYLPLEATPEEKIQAINTLIFDEMEFRFPPHSLYAKDIDVYTFLPSVLDSHRGVCLGVSILYLCLAQRLDLQLEMITPPGHIYVRYRSPQKEINIETTARGVHLDSDEYLNVNTRALQQRTIKEVIGLAHFNQASVFWQQSKPEQAFIAYQKAVPYLSDDELLKELFAYSCLLTGRQEEGGKLLREIKDHVPDHAIVKNTIAEDYLNGHIDAASIMALFSRPDDNRQSILAKKQELETIVQRYPNFRAGLLYLAMAWIQLHRTSEALEILKTYHARYAEDPEVNYYLAVLHGQRMDYGQAWHYLKQAEGIVHAKNYYPTVLKELRQALLLHCPE